MNKAVDLIYTNLENSVTSSEGFVYTDLQSCSLTCGQKSSTQIQAINDNRQDANDSLMRHFIDLNDENNLFLSDDQSYNIPDPSQIILQRIDDECNGFPRDTFIAKLVQICGIEANSLERLRLQYFNNAKKRPDFPYQNAVLKKRVNPKNRNGEPLVQKLGRDCYALRLAVKGEICDDLKDALNVKSLISSVSCDDSIVSSQTANDSTFRQTLVQIESCIVEMKVNFQKEKQEMSRQLGELLRSNDKLIGTINSQKERMHNFQNQLSTIRSPNDKYHSRVLDLEKQLRETVEKQQSDIKHNSNLNDRLTSTENTLIILSSNVKENSDLISKSKSNSNSLTTKVNDLKKRLNSEADRISNISDSRASGVCNLKSRVQILNDQVQDVSSTVEQLPTKMNSFCSSLSEIRKRVNAIERTNKQVTQSESKTYASIATDSSAKTQPETSHKVNPPIDIESSTVTQADVTVKSIGEKLCAGGVPESSFRKNPQISASQKDHTSKEENHKILVHCPSSVCNTVPSEFKGFTIRKTKRVSRFYVGGIDKVHSSEQSMRNFLDENNIHVTFLRYFYRPSKRTAAAQLNIHSEDVSLISDTQFWPDGFFVKPWLPWEQFANEHNINTNHARK